MARSHNIWLVVENDYDGVDPLGAFTVKHEMISWLKSFPISTWVSCSVIRMPDGGKGDNHELTIDELLK